MDRTKTAEQMVPCFTPFFLLADGYHRQLGAANADSAPPGPLLRLEIQENKKQGGGMRFASDVRCASICRECNMAKEEPIASEYQWSVGCRPDLTGRQGCLYVVAQHQQCSD
eukprot:3366565-Amphidinium_carterae.1